jgi:hypothetical protein
LSKREIKVGDCELYAHLWSGEDSWSIRTEQECFVPKLAEGLPELCFSTLKSTGDLICIKRGESGYYKSDWSTDSREKNQELADYNNERLGVTTPSGRLWSAAACTAGTSPARTQKPMKRKNRRWEE